jgi:hypothetical protein
VDSVEQGVFEKSFKNSGLNVVLDSCGTLRTVIYKDTASAKKIQ